MLEQAVQLIGAVLVLVAFGAAQAGRVGQRSRGYLMLNALGSATLAADALNGRQWGSSWSKARGPSCRWSDWPPTGRHHRRPLGIDVAYLATERIVISRTGRTSPGGGAHHDVSSRSRSRGSVDGPGTG